MSTETVNSKSVSLRVEFYDFDREGRRVLWTGTAVSEFTDPEDYRASYSVRIDDHLAEWDNQHKTPYVDECKPVAGEG